MSPCANPYRRDVNEGALCHPVPIPIGVVWTKEHLPLPAEGL